jgi:hypothetical protein
VAAVGGAESADRRAMQQPSRAPVGRKVGIGVALLPTAVADSESDLVRVFGPVREVVTPFYLLMHRDLRRTPHVRALFDFIVSEIKTIRRMLAGDGKAAADRRTKT